MRFINLPPKIKPEFYEKQKEKFVDLAGQYPDIISVYTAGSVSHPGISDLDFILCLKDELSGAMDIEGKLDDDLGHALSGGNILKVNEGNFSDIKTIDDFNMNHILGKEFEFAKFDDELFEICRIMDWLPERLYTTLKMINNGATDVTRGLQVMKSAGLSLSKLAKLTNDDKFYFLGKEIHKLREEWFDNKNNIEDFKKLFKISTDKMREGIKSIAAYINDKGYITGNLFGRSVALHIPNGPRFLFSEKSVADNKNEVVLPGGFALFFASQGILGRGFLSEKLLKSFDIKLTRGFLSGFIKENLLTIIQKRIDYCDSLGEFFVKNNLKKGLLKYGWYLK